MLVLLGLLAQLQIADPSGGTTELAGPWQFRTGDDPAWSGPNVPADGWDTIRIPHDWGSLGHRGYGWYRLELTLGRIPSAPLGLWFRSAATAFEVYVDGQRVGSVGGFPPAYRARTVIPLVVPLPPPSNSAGRHVIAVRVYSAEQVGGLVGRVRLGPIADLQRAAFRPDMILIGAAVLVLGIGLMQVFFWLRRPIASEHAAIFMVCLTLTLFFVCWMPSVRLALEPHVFWLRLYLAMAAAAAASYCVALLRIFDLDTTQQRIVRALMAIYLIQVPVFLVLPSWGAVRATSWVLNPSLLVGSGTSLFIAFQQVRQGTRHARLLVYGTMLLAGTLFYDILNDYGLLAVRPVFPWFTVLGAVGFVSMLSLTTAEKFVETETLALYDRLTGLYRRDVVMNALAREIRRASRTAQPLAVIMLDVDRFKQINDTLGHQAGDRVLSEVGRRMGEAGRAVDWLGRYGGEEFIAVLASADTGGAHLAAERLRKAVSALPISTGRTARTVTLSAGITVYSGSPDEWPTTEQMVGEADAALYRAKNAGRDQVSE